MSIFQHLQTKPAMGSPSASRIYLMHGLKSQPTMARTSATWHGSHGLSIGFIIIHITL